MVWAGTDAGHRGFRAGRRGNAPVRQNTISFQCFAVTKRERCFGFVVATVTCVDAGPNESAWAARITSMSRAFGSAVGSPSCLAFAHSSAARRSASSEIGKYLQDRDLAQPALAPHIRPKSRLSSAPPSAIAIFSGNPE